MKCKSCGANLNIEDKVCPYCGLPNPFAAEHQKEMEHFEREFEDTKTEVIQKTQKLGRRASKITVIAVLVALCAAMLVLLIKADDIYYWRLEKKQNARAAEISAEIEKLIAEDEYSKVGEYIRVHNLIWADMFREYENVYYSSEEYSRVYYYLNELVCREQMSYEYYTEEEIIENIAKEMFRIYEEVTPDQYSDKKNFTKEKKRYMEGLVKQAESMIQYVFGLSDEERDRMSSLSQSRLNVLLEDSYGKKKK